MSNDDAMAHEDEIMQIDKDQHTPVRNEPMNSNKLIED
jgi:hypothetical protein